MRTIAVLLHWCARLVALFPVGVGAFLGVGAYLQALLRGEVLYGGDGEAVDCPTGHTAAGDWNQELEGTTHECKAENERVAWGCESSTVRNNVSK